MPEDIKPGGGDLSVPVDIDISIESDDWPDEATLTRLLDRAVSAVCRNRRRRPFRA